MQQAIYSKRQVPSRRRVLRVAGLLVFADTAALGLTVPALPALLQHLTGTTVAKAAMIGAWLLLANALMQFVFAPLVGSLSDRFGRRPILTIKFSCFALDYFLAASGLGIAVMFVGRIAAGIAGMSFPALNSCVADVVSPSDLGRDFGIIAGVGGIGLIAGAGAGGALVSYAPYLPFLLAGIIAVIAALGVVVLLPETLPPRQTPAPRKPLNPLAGFRHIAAPVQARRLLWVLFLVQFAGQTQIAVWAYYTTGEFGWKPIVVGASIGAYGLGMALVQGVLLTPIVNWLDGHRAAMIGLIAGALGYACFAFAPSDAMLWAGIAIGSLGGLASPLVQSRLSAIADPGEQGGMQGAVAATGGLAAVLGPPLMAAIFAACSDPGGLHFPGAPFLAAAVIVVVAAIVLARAADSKRSPSSGNAV